MRVSVARPGFDAGVNVVGTVNVLEAARQVGARVVFASTGGAIYGECERPGPRGRSLPAALALRRRQSRGGGLPRRVRPALRHAARSRSGFGNVYGPRQDPHGEAGVVAPNIEIKIGAEHQKEQGDRQSRTFDAASPRWSQLLKTARSMQRSRAVSDAACQASRHDLLDKWLCFANNL